MADIQTQLPVKITDGTNTAAITGSSALKVDGSAVTQPVSGTVAVSNFPATQPVSGTVAVSSVGGTVTISGTVTANAGTGTLLVDGSGHTQPVSGTVAVSSVGGTVTTAPGEVATGIVTSYGTSAAVADAATGTLTYTVTSGKTLYLKQIIASASGAPCKVVVDYGAGPTVIAVGFFSTAVPVLDFTFAQPVSIAASTAVNVKITNHAGAAQDVYATIFGHEI